MLVCGDNFRHWFFWDVDRNWGLTLILCVGFFVCFVLFFAFTLKLISLQGRVESKGTFTPVSTSTSMHPHTGINSQDRRAPILLRFCVRIKDYCKKNIFHTETIPCLLLIRAEYFHSASGFLSWTVLGKESPAQTRRLHAGGWSNAPNTSGPPNSAGEAWL